MRKPILVSAVGRFFRAIGDRLRRRERPTAAERCTTHHRIERFSVTIGDVRIHSVPTVRSIKSTRLEIDGVEVKGVYRMVLTVESGMVPELELTRYILPPRLKPLIQI